MISVTSETSFQEIRDSLGQKQFQILNYLALLGHATNNEISKQYGIPINCVTPRIKELREMGIVTQVSKRPCKVTGRRAMVWEVLRPSEALRNFRLYLARQESVEIKREIQPELF